MRILSRISAIICSVMLAAAFYTAAPTEYTPSVEVQAASRVDLNYLMKKYPDGKYWNHVGMNGNNADGYTDKPCHHSVYGGYYHTNGTCNYFNQIQCWGFVNKLANLCYGSQRYTDWPRTTLAKLKAGDAIRFKNNSHSIFVTGVDGSIVTYGECNGNYTDCKIRWNLKITKAEIARTLTAAYSAPAELTVNFENRTVLTKTDYKFGEKVNITASTAGGSGNVRYEFSVLKPNEKNYAVVQKYSDSKYCSYKPWVRGTYKFKVSARDSSGRIAEKVFSFSVTADELVNTSSADKSSLKSGENITLSLSAKGGTSGYHYRVRIKFPGSNNYTVIKNYSANTSFVLSPAEFGNYTFKTDVKDSSGSVSTKNISFKVTTKPLKNLSSMAKQTNSGEEAVINLSASGGAGDYSYSIEMTSPGSSERITLRKSTKGKKYAYRLTETGKYTFYVTVNDSDGNAKTETLATFSE